MPPAPGGNEPDHSLTPIWVSVFIFFVLGLIWVLYKEYIVAFIFSIKHLEALAIAFILPESWLPSLNQSLNFMNSSRDVGYANVSVNDIYSVSKIIGDYLRYPVMAILGALAMYVYFHSPILRYKKTHSMKTLLQQEKKNWPQITPVSRLDLVNTDIHEGPWAMALQPLEFAKVNNLLILEQTSSGEGALDSKDVTTASIQRDEARKIFAMQLGAFWTTPEQLPIYARSLFAIFAARIVGEREGAAKLLQQIAISTESGQLNFSGCDELLKKHRDNKIVKKITRRHAFVLTAMASMLEAARQDGVVATADFLWLKPIDRRLWYMLNTIGRQTPFAEVSGPYAHWLIEKELDRKLNLPFVDEAVNALEVAIKEIIIAPEEDN